MAAVDPLAALGNNPMQPVIQRPLAVGPLRYIELIAVHDSVADLVLPILVETETTQLDYEGFRAFDDSVFTSAILGWHLRFRAGLRITPNAWERVRSEMVPQVLCQGLVLSGSFQREAETVVLFDDFSHPLAVIAPPRRMLLQVEQTWVI